MNRVFHLAHLNIARMKYGYEDPAMQDFMDALDPVNAVADSSPGFVWRLQEEEPGEALIWNDPGWLVNLSVWEDLDSLKTFVRTGLHLEVMKRRREWFLRSVEAYVALWWIPAGHIPSMAEAQSKLDRLRAAGPCPEVFGFADPHPPPTG